mmetsp:Transcript_7011/g.9903  ORF Transcript_7011/g.9903 Transcript_7011/m.9903 type:complete len:342 (+) Transcript_7011:192-1217(+)
MSSTLEPRMTTAVNGRRQQQQQQQYHGYGRQQQHHQNHPPHGGSDTDSLSTAWKPPAKDPFAPPSPVRNHHYHNEDAPPASPAAYRTNFGKHKSYTPPDTGTSGQHYHGTGTPPRMGAGRTPRQAAAVVSPPILPRPVSTSYGDDDDDIPFDQRQANLNEAGPSFDENDFVGRGISANNQRRAYNRFDDTTVEEKKVAEYTNLNFVISEEKKQPKSILKKGGRSMSEDESSAEQDDIDEEDSLLQSSPEQQEKHKQQQQQQQQEQQIIMITRQVCTVFRLLLLIPLHQMIIIIIVVTIIHNHSNKNHMMVVESLVSFPMTVVVLTAVPLRTTIPVVVPKKK